MMLVSKPTCRRPLKANVRGSKLKLLKEFENKKKTTKKKPDGVFAEKIIYMLLCPWTVFSLVQSHD